MGASLRGCEIKCGSGLGIYNKAVMIAVPHLVTVMHFVNRNGAHSFHCMLSM